MATATDDFTLEQLRLFLLVVQEGSFSAAARETARVQSAVSQAMSTLERNVGLTLWDRSDRLPKLTEEGESFRLGALQVCAEANRLQELVDNFHRGVEGQVRLCVDALFPLSVLAAVCSAFALEFPRVDLRVDTQTMSSVVTRVLEGTATMGVAANAPDGPDLTRSHLASIAMIPVAASHHPLAQRPSPLSAADLADSVQLVLTERDPNLDDQGVLSPRTWRIADLPTKHALLTAGLGWGNLPAHLASADLDAGRLRRLVRADSPGEYLVPLSVVRRRGFRLGPAHRWLAEALTSFCQDHLHRGPQGSVQVADEPE